MEGEFAKEILKCRRHISRQFFLLSQVKFFSKIELLDTKCQSNLVKFVSKRKCGFSAPSVYVYIYMYIYMKILWYVQNFTTTLNRAYIISSEKEPYFWSFLAIVSYCGVLLKRHDRKIGPILELTMYTLLKFFLISTNRYIYISNVGDRYRGWPEGSLFDSYNTKVYGRALLLSLGYTTPLYPWFDSYLIMLRVKQGSIKYYFLRLW